MCDEERVKLFLLLATNKILFDDENITLFINDKNVINKIKVFLSSENDNYEILNYKMVLKIGAAQPSRRGVHGQRHQLHQ